MLRVGALHGGHPHALDDKTVPPAQRLRVATRWELNNPYSSTDSDEGLLG